VNRHLRPRGRSIRVGSASVAFVCLCVLSVLATPQPGLADHGISCFGETSAHIYTGYESNDYITGDSVKNIMAGKGGLDNMFGNNGHDKICGNAGGDSVNGNNGDDSVDGGSEADYVLGQDGEDELRGGDHSDLFIFGGDNNDQMFGEHGNDLLDDVGVSGGGANDYGDGGPGLSDECTSEIETRVQCEIT
jgi:Ca2+-binding RTX toxin-like protein